MPWCLMLYSAMNPNTRLRYEVKGYIFYNESKTWLSDEQKGSGLRGSMNRVREITHKLALLMSQYLIARIQDHASLLRWFWYKPI